MNNNIKKFLSILLGLLIISLSITGCEANEIKTSSNAKVTKFKIGKDIYIEPIVANVSGDKLSRKEIENIVRKLFKQASIVYQKTYFLADELDVDYSNSIKSKIPDEFQFSFAPDNTFYEWHKILYIETWEQLREVCESVFSRDFYERQIYKYAQLRIIENYGELYQCQDLVGGQGGPCNLEATSSKIVVISQEEDKIKIKANMKGLKGLGIDDKWEDGDFVYTLLRQNGYWVLEDFDGIGE